MCLWKCQTHVTSNHNFLSTAPVIEEKIITAIQAFLSLTLNVKGTSFVWSGRLKSSGFITLTSWTELLNKLHPILWLPVSCVSQCVNRFNQTACSKTKRPNCSDVERLMKFDFFFQRSQGVGFVWHWMGVTERGMIVLFSFSAGRRSQTDIRCVSPDTYSMLHRPRLAAHSHAPCRLHRNFCLF